MSLPDRFFRDDSDDEEEQGLTTRGRTPVPDTRPQLRGNVLQDDFGDMYVLVDNADTGGEWITSYEFVNAKEWA